MFVSSHIVDTDHGIATEKVSVNHSQPAGNEERRARERHRVAVENELNEQLAAINAAQARVCELIYQHDVEGMWHDNSVRSENAYLTWRAGLTASEANRYLRLAHKLVDLPHLRAAFAAGRLSMSQVAVVASIADKDTDRSLTELAEGLSASQLTTVASYYRKALESEEDPGRDRFVRLTYDSRGRARLAGLMPSDQGVVLEKALAALADELPLEESDDIADPWGMRNADALTLMAENALAGQIQTRSGPDAFRAIIHVDEQVLKDADAEGQCYIHGAGAISSETARRLTCDSQVAIMTEREGKPLSVGRASRTFKGAIRHALEARDKMCCWPGCGRRVHLQNHHIKHWVDHGETSLENGIRLCWFHHRKLHEGGYRIERDGDGWRFVSPEGRIVTRPPPQPASKTVDELNQQRGVKVDEETGRPEWGGEKGNLRYVADVYLMRDPRLADPPDSEAAN